MTPTPDNPTETPAARGSTEGSEPRGRKPYRPPRLEVFGDVRDVTLGSTPGGAESGPIPFRPVGGG